MALFRQFTFLFLMPFFLLAGFSAPAAAARLGAPVGKQMLSYTITANQTGTDVKVDAVVGPLYMSTDGYTLKRGVTPIRSSAIMGVVPVPAYANGLTQKQVQSKANAFFQEYYPLIRDSIQNWMRSHKISHAWLRYRQTVNVASSSGTDPMIISWNAFIDATGRGIMPNPKLIAAGGLKILQVEYAPVATGEGVSFAQNWENAGLLRWRVLNEFMQPISSWSEVQTNGAYDEPPDPGDETPIDPDAGVRCLVSNSRPGCVQTYPDVVTLMSETNAQIAVVDYARRVEPVYCREDDAACLSTGVPSANLPDSEEAEFVPLTAFVYDLRTFGGNSCGSREFRNHGWRGNRLNLTVDRYLAFASGDYQHANQLSKNTLSQPMEFDLLVTVGSEDDAGTLAGKVIHPDYPLGLMDARNVPGIIELSPVTLAAEQGGTFDVLAQAECGFFLRYFKATARCHPSGGIGLSIRSWRALMNGDNPEVLLPRGTPSSGRVNLSPGANYTITADWIYDGNKHISIPGFPGWKISNGRITTTADCHLYLP